MKVLLFSGIPLNLKSSFYWQLTLLRDGFRKRGIEATLISPVSERIIDFNNKIYDTILFLDYKGNNILKLIYQKSPDAIILLGYPRDFPFLPEYSKNSNDNRFPRIYLWAQFSKTPVLNGFFKDEVYFIPLTDKNGEYCRNAGAKRVLDPIPHGVPIDIYYPADINKKSALRNNMGLNGLFVMGIVAKNIIRKRLNDVIKAFSLASKKIDNAYLIIKTDRYVSNEGYNLHFLVDKYGVVDKTKIILGDFERHRMAALYNCMDAYIQLSEWEGFGIPVIEAMACGLPIITHDAQGPGEIVNGAGILIKSHDYVDDSGAHLSHADVEEAANAIYTLYKDIELREKLANNAVKIVRENFSINKIVDRWVNLWRYTI